MTYGWFFGPEGAVQGLYFSLIFRTGPASVRVVPLESGCAPTGPTLAVLSERTERASLTCRSHLEIVEAPLDTVAEVPQHAHSR